MEKDLDFRLYNWLQPKGHKAEAVLGGSATPAFCLNDLVALSSDPEKTKEVLSLGDVGLGLPDGQGRPELLEAIASTYDKKLSGLGPKDIIIANATTGANHIVYRALLSPGDHVVVQYPTYGPLIEEPRHIGCDISYLRLDPSNSWQPDLNDLEGLIRPGITRLLILNNPSNPTGTHLTTATQRKLVALAQQYNLIIHCDEIFRPLFHDGTTHPTSLNEHLDTFPEFHNIVTTSSLSKVYGLSGIRIGWIVSRSPELMHKFMHMRLYTMEAASALDEVVATEVLGPRCRPAILQKHHSMAVTNIDLFQNFIDRNPKAVEWVRPTAGAVGFVKFLNPRTGEAVDDVDFCQKLLDKKKVLLSPASLCFQISLKGDTDKRLASEFRGRVRMQFTTNTDSVKKGIELVEEFLREEDW